MRPKAALAARVSRETLERLELYAQLLTKWQAAINLVAPSTLSQIWLPHMLDSAQVFRSRAGQRDALDRPWQWRGGFPASFALLSLLKPGPAFG